MDPPEQGGAPAGDLLTGVPRWMFNVFGAYKVKAGTFAGLVIGGGWNRTADSEGNLPNDKYRIAGNTRLDLLAEYPFTASTKLQLNINNVTNEISYATPASGALVFANKPREAVLTLTTRR
jgi:outer membrane receptor protein involved in Fe transport